MFMSESQILSQCEGKFAFESLSAARASFSRNRKKGRQAYHCAVCKKYHVGSSKTTRGRKLQRIKFNEKRGVKC